MPRYVHVPTDATAQLIRQAYEAGGPYQWAREGWRNSQESGADKIHFDVERQAAENLGVLRRLIMDNGSGMAPDDMRDFLTTFGGGGKPIGVDSNFGQGFKSAVLPWNPYGVVVISYAADYPDGAMLWIQRDAAGNYALREWSVEDEEDATVFTTDVIRPFDDPEHGCDWARIRPAWMTTGTIMVLLGDGLRADTIDGDPEPTRGESSKGLVRYLNSRVLDIPATGGSRIDTTVVELEQAHRRQGRATKDVTITLAGGKDLVVHQRKVNGLRHFIPESALKGAVAVDTHGTVVEWFFVPEPAAPVAGSADYVAQRPVVVVDYQGEAYHADSSKHRYRQFGIADEIMGRTWLIVRPPVYSDKRPTDWGVLTQASRNMLISKGGAELPWEAWGDAFYNDFPTELAKARDQARASAATAPDPNMAKHLSRVLDRLNPRFKATRLLANALGKLSGHPAGTSAAGGANTTVRPPRRRPASGVGSGGGAKVKREALAGGAGGPLPGAEQQVRAGHPTYRWKAFDQEDAKFLADFSPKDDVTIDEVTYRGVVWLNQAHPVFVQEFDHWATAVWPKADPKKVAELVQRVYGEEAVAHVVHAQRLSGTVVSKSADGTVIQIGREDVEQMTSKASLSAAMLGLVNVEQRILTQGGGVFGSRATTN